MVQLCSHRAQRPSRHEGGTGLSYAPLRGMRNVRIADTLPVGAPSGPSNIRTPTGYSPLPGIEMRARPALPPATLASTETGAGSAWVILGQPGPEDPRTPPREAGQPRDNFLGRPLEGLNFEPRRQAALLLSVSRAGVREESAIHPRIWESFDWL